MKAEIRQTVEQEIADKKIMFGTLEERNAFIDQRMRQEIHMDLDVCM
jgi:hypothetical protein